ncbi:MAG: ATP-grasp domain-containing protein, partial [Candidatus Magasanikbacteria bacterium]|nr:ATP-grasp domain-containing protein [Candidatus Magasanikbacteria bacterium]
MTDKIVGNDKNIILVAGLPPKSLIGSLREYATNQSKTLEFAVILPKNQTLNEKQKDAIADFDHIIFANFENDTGIADALLPHRDRLLGVTCRAEAYIPQFQKVIPHVPYLRTPTVKSLEWSTNKIAMRKRFRMFDKKITPEFMVVMDAKKKTIEEIATKVGFPLVIKPTGLAQSVLVNIVYHKEELVTELRKVFRKMNKAWKEAHGRGEPTLLVEQFMDGDMYSVEAFVSSRGK